MASVTASPTPSPPGGLRGAFAAGNTPWTVAVDPNTHRAFILGNAPTATITVLDTLTGQTLTTITTTMVLGNPCCVTATDFAHHRLMISSSNNTILIDTQDMSVVGLYAPSPAMALSAFDTTDDNAYIAQREDQTIAVINPSGAVSTTIATPSEPQAMVVSGGLLYVGDMSDGTLSVYDATTGAPTGTIATGIASPTGINHLLVSQASGLLFATATDGRVVAINLTTNSIVATIATGGLVTSLVEYTGTTPRILVTSRNALTVLDAMTGELVAQTALQFTPVSAAVVPTTGQVVVVGQDGAGNEWAEVLSATTGLAEIMYSGFDNPGNMLLGLEQGQDTAPLGAPAVVSVDEGTSTAFMLIYGGSTVDAVPY